tara:strand:- start:486 stop:1025 length:540 start_codon:yes stop_codon:yes gene_type:complete
MRVFIAIEISNEEILEKIQTFQKNVKIDAKPTRVEQIHFTLQFLGEIDDAKCEQIKDLLNEISFSEFDVSLKNVGGFPNLRNPRVIWIGLEKVGAEKLIDLANEIGTKLTKIGFEKDKKFKPHLTVFRVKKRIENASSIMENFEAMEFGTERISKIKLKKSVLSPKGPEYSDLLEVNAR